MVPKKLRALLAKGESPLAMIDSHSLPEGTSEILTFLATGEYPDRSSEAVAEDAEGQRMAVAASQIEPIEIFYSPKPGSAHDAERPQAGARLLFSPERIANTGKDRRWGSVLHLCARNTGARTVLELGTCAGISAYYMASADNVERLVTVEGSAQLAAIARETVGKFGDRVDVVNALFDDALDTILDGDIQIDLAYIDGHHEKVATIHYFDRISPKLSKGAWVLFDDISWSQDMRDGWNVLTERSGFTHCLDLGAIGICIWDGGSQKGRVLDLRKITGATKINAPHGWKYEEGAVVR